GPGAGVHGGEVVAAGTPAEIAAQPRSETGAWLAGRRRMPERVRRPCADAPRLVVSGCRARNLQDVSVAIPLGRFTVVTGVSGSGKSTLVSDTLHPILAGKLHGALGVPGAHERIAGVEQLDKVIEIDQAPIGRTPRSNPATYTGVVDGIRRPLPPGPDA